MKKISTVIICLLFTIAITAQTNDFLISGDDNFPSTIIQNSPKLHPYNSGKFLTTWKDYREGDVSSYAQWFDSLGSRIGNNFRVFADEQIIFGENDIYICIKEEHGTFFSYTSYFINAQVFQHNQPISFQFQVEFLLPEMFDVDPLGVDFKCIYSNGKFLFFIRKDGYITLKAFDTNGNFLFVKELIDDVPFRAASVACASDSSGNYLMTSFNARKYYNEWERNDTIPLGIYANIFNAYDSLVIQNILLKEFPDEDFHYQTWNSPLLECINLNDSLWQVFWFDTKAAELNFVKINNQGRMMDSISTFHLPSNAPTTFINSFSLSQISDQKFSLFISTRGIPQNGLIIYFHSLFNFNKDGQYINELSQVVGFYSPLSFKVNKIFRSSDSAFFCVSDDTKDINLNSVSEFLILNSIRINEDSSGSNENSPSAAVIDEDNYFVSWKNESGNYGVSIDSEGKQTEEVRQYESTSFFFLPSGSFYNIWQFTDIFGDIGYNYGGYTLYNLNREVIRKDTLLFTQGSIGILKLSDSLNLLYYSKAEEITLLLIDADGNNLKEKKIELGNIGELVLYKVNETSFIVHRFDKNQYFNSDLEPASNIFNLFYNLYIGDSKFLQIEENISEFQVNGSIVDTAANLIKEFTITKEYYQPNTFTVHRLPNSGFAYLHNLGGEIVYTGSYSSEGTQKTKPFLIHDEVLSIRKQPSMIFNNDHVIFVWSDSRDSSKGYDIYGRITDKGKLVSVEKGIEHKPNIYHLSQNYPNPFNPVTTIRYSLPKNSQVQIKVFDIIGREVATLVNDEKPAGEHSIKFDATHLSSGIYLYKITAGKFTQSRKMLVLK